MTVSGKGLMSRGIERDIRQMVGETELPPPPAAENMIAT